VRFLHWWKKTECILNQNDIGIYTIYRPTHNFHKPHKLILLKRFDTFISNNIKNKNSLNYIGNNKVYL